MSSDLLPNIFSSLRRFSGVLALVSLLGSAAVTTADAATSSYGPINNQATATYQETNPSDPLSGPITFTVTSKTVTAQVESITLVTDLQVQGSAGGAVKFVHTLSNNGSIDTQVSLQPSNLSGDNFDLSGLQVVNDLNGNGIADPSEPVLTPSDHISLAVGASVQLIFSGTVPLGVNDADISKLLLLATASLGATAQVNDTVTIKSHIAPQLDKTASVSSSAPGQLISYTLKLSTGDALKPHTVNVDGSDRQLIVVSDAIPAYTVFNSIQQDAGAIRLYQVYGGASNQYQTTVPSDLGTVSAVAFGFASLADNSSVSVQFQIKVGQAASDHIDNIGNIEATINGQDKKQPSNTKTVTVPKQDGSLQYRDSGLTKQVTVTKASESLNLFAVAPICNADANTAGHLPVTLVSTGTGDTETLPNAAFKGEMVETGPNTGVFTLVKIPAALLTTPPPTNNNGVIETVYNDTVKATMVCQGQTLVANVLINPAVVVYDSATGVPVDKAIVSFVTNPVVVSTADGSDYSSTLKPQQATTGPDGVFQVPLDSFDGQNNYAYKVLPPSGYKFPSIVPAASQPKNRNFVNGASVGAIIYGPKDVREVVADLPLDRLSSGLNLKKQVSQSTAEIGETVTYTVTVLNSTGQTLDNVVVNDTLPVGFTLVSRTARLNGAVAANPVGAPGRNLTFSIGTLPDKQSAVLTYVALLGTGASAGDGVNSAVASSSTKINNVAVTSNTGRVKVLVDKGVFSDEAMIFGKIFVDCNRDDLQGREELGIPGVRMYLDDGTFVISDEEGKYSFYGISPRTHVLKIDRTTLPAGAEMATLSNRNAGDPQSQFVDLKNGEMHRADFAEGSCTPAILEEVKARRKAGEVLGARLNTASIENDALLKPLRTDAEAIVDPRTRPASGTIDANGQIVVDTSAFVAASATNSYERGVGSPMGPAPLAKTASVNLETLLPKLESNKFGFLDLKDGDTLPGTELSIRVAGREGSIFRLFVNEEEVPASRIGQRAHMSSRDLQVFEYVAVRLMPGVNKLRAENYDAFGNLHETASVMLTAPGKPGKLAILLPPDGAVADGQTPAHVIVRLLDADGVPVTARTFITLESSVGRWNVEDLDDKTPGIQTVMQGGEALFDLIPPSNPGNADLRVSSGIIETTARLPLDPHLRPLIASGIIEGAIGFNKLSSKAVTAATPADGFDQDITNLSNSDNTQAGIRGSMFLKGKVKGNYLLTLSYDSDKDTQERLFRDIDPEKYYPIYGDSSIKGFDAQSTSKLYVRIDKGRSYLLYGDFNTNDQADSSQARQLSNYSRSLTGVREHYETDKVVVNLFASHQTSTQQTTEFRAQGISGPYQLPGGHFVINSEKIERIVRSYNQPGVVVETTQLNRFIDYTIDEIKGTIILTQPMAGVDAVGNPVYIRVTWEVDSGGDAYWVYGADGRYRLAKFLEVGGTVIRDNSPGATTTLYGANATVTLSQDTKATFEVARSNSEAVPAGSSISGAPATLDASGTAWRAELTRSGSGAEGRVYVSRSDADFYNPNGGLTSGTTEAGVKGGFQINPVLRLATEGLYTKSDTTGTGAREGVFARLEYALTENIKTSLGLRFTRQEAADALPADANAAVPVPQSGINAIPAGSTTSINGKISWNPQFLPKASVFTEYEQSVTDAAAKALSVGGTYQIADRSRFYASHSLIKSTTGPFGLSELSQTQNSTQVGVDYGYMKNASVFSEYRIRDTQDGIAGGASAAAGLRNSWNWSAFRLSTQFERDQPLDSSVQADGSTALSLGLQYVGDPLLKAGTRFEWRQGASQKSFLDTIALARKLSRDWSVLGKNTLSWTSTGTETAIVPTAGLADMGGATIRDRFRVGAAWRQTDSNEWAWLGLYETRYDRDPSIDNRRIAHILSSNVNYQPDRQWVLSGRYAMKYVNETSSGAQSRFIGNLVSGRAMFDISEKWDAGVISSVVFDQHTVQYGIGAEVGYLITSNLWLSGGYNFTGYEDKDYDASNSTRKGPYMRLRFKFDEEMFRWLE